MTIAGELFEASKLNYWFCVQIDQIVIKSVQIGQIIIRSGCMEGHHIQLRPVDHYEP